MKDPKQRFLLRAGVIPPDSPNSNGVSHKRSKAQEKQMALRIGGHVTPGSGNQAIKGDVRKPKVVRIECKTTQKKSFSVTQKMIDKIEEAALPHGETPALVIEFIDADGNPLREVAILPTYALEECYGET